MFYVWISISLLVLSMFVRELHSGFCTQSYACVRVCYKRTTYSYSCGWWGWGTCYAYRSVTESCYGTCYRQTCCPGYTGSGCNTPILSLDEPLKISTSCETSNVAINCGQNMAIVVRSIQYAHRTGCNTQCCSYSSDDCFVDASDAELLDIRRDCTGQQECTHAIQPAHMFCAYGLTTTSYVVVKYFCLPRQRMISIYSTAKVESTSPPLYLTNADLSQRISRSVADDTRSCSVEVYSCSSDVKLFMLDTDVFFDPASCSQTVTFLDATNTSLYTIQCSSSSHSNAPELQLQNNYIKIDVSGERRTAEDTFILGFESTDPNAKFSITCSYEAATWCIDCRPVPDISSGILQLDSNNNTEYGATATVACFPGFETSTPSVKCLEQGNWDNVTCSAKDCGKLPEIKFGDSALSDENNSSYGATATVVCDTGFETSTPIVSCLPSGEWYMAKCTVKDCGPVPNITNALVVLNDVTNTTYGAWASVYCGFGYETDIPNITCMATGKWSSSYCTGKDCGDLPVIEFGEAFLHDETNSTYGASAYVVCEDGFETNKSLLYCQATQLWENSVCFEKDCRNLPQIEHGDVSLVNAYNSKFGSAALAFCDEGYETSTSVIICKDTGEWMEPACTGKDCGELPGIFHGNAELNDNNNSTYGAQAAVVCDSGYIASVDSITCMKNQSWTTATCYGINCGEMVGIENGKTVLNVFGNTSYGATASVLCNKGYVTATPNISCQETGTWEYAECQPKDCGPPPFIPHGNVSLDDEGNSLYGSSASIMCDEGYEAENLTIFCLDTGDWSHFTCTGKECGTLPLIAFGEALLDDEDNVTYGASANIVCRSGFEANVSSITCLASGNWESAKCTSKDCGPLPVIVYGSVSLDNKDNSTYEATATVACYSGYQTTTPVIICQNNGLWSDSFCTGIDCGNLTQIEHGYSSLVDAYNSKFGSAALVTCADGYEPSAPVITCQYTGVWMDSTCVGKDCGKLPDILYGTAELKDGSNSTYGAKASVVCDSGYMTSNDMITCMENQSWTAAACHAIDCGEVGIIENGTAVLNSYGNTSYGALATVLCNKGFQTSTPIISCQANTTWEYTECRPKDCGPLPKSPYGNATLDVEGISIYGASASITCNEGYETDNLTIFCLDAGNWAPFACVGKECGTVPLIAFGEALIADEYNFTYGASANIVCRLGFEANVSSITCLASGYWESATCKSKDCGPLPEIEYGSVSLDNKYNSTYEATATVVCYSGYQTTTPVIICQDNGLWSESFCTGIDCGNLIPIQHGNISLVDEFSSDFGSAALVSCEEGYEPSTSVIICQNTGEWMESTCFGKDCGDLPGILYGTAELNDDNNSTYGAQAAVVCDSGYMASEDFIICEKNQTWTTATCFGIDCGAVAGIANGTAILNLPGNTTYGATALISCDSGFVADRAILSCQANGTWEYTACRLKDCGPPPFFPYGNAFLDDEGNSNYGASASVICDEGYKTDNYNILCLDSGNWSSFTCSGKDCGSAPTIQFGHIELNAENNSTYGATAYVTCNTGYATMNSEIICMKNGSWSSVQCTAIDCGQSPLIWHGNTILLDGVNTTYGALAEVSCYPGYETVSSIITCLDSGNWSTSICTPKDCEHLPLIEHGNSSLVDVYNSKFGSAALVFCEEGYEASAPVISCQVTGEWMESVCIGKDCGEMPSILYGTPVLNDINNSTYGAQAAVVCDSGYMASIDFITCMKNQSWTTATCYGIDCGALADIANGTLVLSVYGNTSYRATASVSCETGFETVLPLISCLANGTWEYGECTPKDCGPPPFILNGNASLVEEGSSTYGASANVVCDEGYEADSLTILCLATGNWSAFSCDGKDCGPFQYVTNGQMILLEGSDTTYGGMAEVTCYPGYETTIPMVTCLSSGNWLKSTCTAKDCGHVPDIAYGYISLDDDGNTTYGATATVVCDAGYEPTKRAISCLQVGSWSKSYCLALDCGQQLTIPLASVYLNNDVNTTFGASASVVCEPGYVTDIETIYCLDSGTWSTSSCTGIDCGFPPLLSNGDTTLTDAHNTTYGSSASVNCEDGYETSTPTIVCQKTGKWSISMCHGIDCGPVPLVRFGDIILDDRSNMSYGASARLTCYPGWKATVTVLYCLASGNWSNSSCYPIECGPYPNVIHGNVVPADSYTTTFGTIGGVICELGYVANKPFLICQESGHWSSTNCIGIDCGELPVIQYGEATLNDSTNSTFGASAIITCNEGYETSTLTISCQATSMWTSAACRPIVNKGKKEIQGSLIYGIVGSVLVLLVLQLIAASVIQYRLYIKISQQDKERPWRKLKIAGTIVLQCLPILGIPFILYSWRSLKHTGNKGINKYAKESLNKQFHEIHSTERVINKAPAQSTFIANTQGHVRTRLPPFPPVKADKGKGKVSFTNQTKLQANLEPRSHKFEMTRGLSANFIDPYDDLDPIKQLPRAKEIAKTLQATPSIPEQIETAEFMENHEPCEEAYNDLIHPNPFDLQEHLKTSEQSAVDEIEESDLILIHKAYENTHFHPDQELQEEQELDEITFSLYNDEFE